LSVTSQLLFIESELGLHIDRLNYDKYQ